MSVICNVTTNVSIISLSKERGVLYSSINFFCMCLALALHFKGMAVCRVDYPIAHVQHPNSAAYSSSGLFATANSNSGDVSVFSVGADGSLTPVPGSPFDSASAASWLAFSPDGDHLAVANYGNGPGTGGSVAVFDVAGSGALMPVAGSPFSASNCIALAYSPDGSYLSATLYGSSTVLLFSVDSQGVLNSIGSGVTGTQPISVAFSPDSSLVAVANYNVHSISIFTASQSGLTEVANSPFPNGDGTYPTSVAFSPDGLYLAVSNGISRNVSVYKVGPGVTLTPVPGSPFYAAGSYPTGGIGLISVAFSPDGSHLAVANRNSRNISIFSVGINGTLTPLPDSPFDVGGQPESVAYSSDGAFIATANGNANTVSVFTVACSDAAALSGLLNRILQVYFRAP